MAKKINFSDLEIETQTSLIHKIKYVSRNHTLIIPSKKCISSNALRKSAVEEMNYLSQNHTADPRSALDERHFVDRIICVQLHDKK